MDHYHVENFLLPGLQVCLQILASGWRMHDLIHRKAKCSWNMLPLQLLPKLQTTIQKTNICNHLEKSCLAFVEHFSSYFVFHRDYFWHRCLPLFSPLVKATVIPFFIFYGAIFTMYSSVTADPEEWFHMLCFRVTILA